MDRNRNEDITPEDTELAGTGQDRGRDTDKLAPDRTDSGVQRGRDGFKGRAGEGAARPADPSAHDDIPSKTHDL